MTSDEFRLKSDYAPKGSQPKAIAELTEGVKSGKQFQTLLGVTGSGKTFTIANVIQNLQRPTLVLAHNKTLAGQLYNEFKEFFPDNHVEYFISYYDYYQPESYIPKKDQYIEKDASINPKIEMMRLAATASLLSHRDTIVVASVSCIYSIGNPDNFQNMGFELKTGQRISRRELMEKLVEILFERNDTELMPGRFRVKGDTIDIIPGYFNDIIRIELFGDEIDRISEIEKATGKVKEKLDYFYVYPARHFVTPKEEIEEAITSIRTELDNVLAEGKLDDLGAHRLRQRTEYDIEMIEETGSCKGIENYSRHFDKRNTGERPFCLLDYFPDDFLLVIDESHQSLPQVRGMFNGDHARKIPLVEYGFRLPSAFDNRPLMFSEFEKFMKQAIFVSATPGEYELEHSGDVVEQIIRPTGLVDPVVEVRPIQGQTEDLMREIRATIERGDRALVTTLTKKLAEELSEYLAANGIKTRYLHSDIKTLERTELIRQLRLGMFDVLVGINLLREGLDIPEVGFIGILDADKEGFLRNTRSLIQIIGRAARNAESHVVLYADVMTDSIKAAIAETARRRHMQIAFNEENGITPQTIRKPIPEKEVDLKDIKHIPSSEIPNLIIQLEAEMKTAAGSLDFERAIELRDRIAELQKKLDAS
ncbi:MAG TPA: excinuclease ABC subunit UvrB [Methanocorpusculum sp.]|jgi:excinuclease ABC subunit B|nr:excinuclease ABC subunit UvrB [Methanocorpusculum sp.]MBR5815233.1 excinuclease ABC subunit UvrB [Methanocorpusculaceae archaeon]MBR5007660.1 excinuclease ABC subunit UvrB [Methanocorpusculum sp.]MBR5143149.1 excinuclease ABC subunit UvrB [Methanocorpusculum sp.]HJJ65116.1 excinuclease ABC subunit UvrB [Methanocorpusculum sp.]